MNELIEAFLSFKLYNQGKSENTISKYRGYLQRLDKYLIGKDLQLLQASSEDLEHFTGLYAHEQGLSPRSRRAMVAAVRGLYQWCYKNKLVKEDVAINIPYPSAGKRLPVAMSLQNAQKLLMQPDINTFLGIRDAAIISILIGCGPRASGIVSLNESSLNWVDDKGKELLVIKFIEKGKKERLVPAPEEVRLLVRAYLGHPDLKAIDRTLSNGDLVLFVSTANYKVPPHEYHGENRRLKRLGLNAIIKKYGDQAGIPGHELHAHALRHRYGTELAESDVDILQRQALMGHEDPATTEIYTQLAMRKLVDTVKKANPLGKIHTPVTDLSKALEKNS